MSIRANLIQTSNENRASDSSLSGRYNVRNEEDKFFNLPQQEVNSIGESVEEEALNERSNQNINEDDEEKEEEIQSPKKPKIKINNLFKKFRILKRSKPLQTDYDKVNENIEQNFENQTEDPGANYVLNKSQEQESMLEKNLNENADSCKSQETKELYFQRKIRNSGFWGKVAIRKGTWFVIIGLIFMSIGLTVISVFWRWWYGPAVNIPCRTAGVTFLSLGFLAFLFGLISNCMMVQDPLSKHFIGSPPRPASWVLLASIFGLTIASDLMTIYYTYWHNRFVNNPMIAVSIILFFFSPIAFVWSILKNFSELKKMRIKFDSEYAKKIQQRISKKNEKKKTKKKQENCEEEVLDETLNDVMNNDEDFQLNDETTNSKIGFRAKNLKLKPRTNNPVFTIPPQ